MCPVLCNVNFIYLIDELENIEAGHQKYINTLVRERRGPVTFRLGARNYGIRTRKTLAAQEENRPGSEFDLHRLDDYLRSNKQRYREFSRNLVISRLQQGGFIEGTGFDGIDPDHYFESGDESKPDHLDIEFVLMGRGERRYFRRLKKQLTKFQPKMTAQGLSSIEDIKKVIERLRVPDRPILEKINILFLYRAWYRRLNLVKASARIARDCERYRKDGPDLSRYAVTVQHFAIDMYAQLCREYHRRFRYRGMETLITLSDGIPRNLLILLKAIYKWARFAGEEPFSLQPISSKAQYRGVMEAAEWFHGDAPVGGGQAALDARNAVGRLGQLFRELVYSDKPPECSLSTFSGNVTEVSVRNTLDVADTFSLLVKISGGQKDRNTGRIDDKYQINRMLVPRWVLPLARRGTLALSSKELRLVVDPESDEEFNRMKTERIARANVPFRKSKKRQSRRKGGTMPTSLC